MEIVNKTRLDGSPDEIRKKATELGRALAPHEHAAGARFRELAVKLALDPRLSVWVLTYKDESQELEVTQSDGSQSDPIVLGRSQSGSHCQLSWDTWLPVINDTDTDATVGLIAVLLGIGAPSGELDSLNWAWGDAYDMGISGGKCFARRVEGNAETLFKDTARELNLAIREDWSRKSTDGGVHTQLPLRELWKTATFH